MSWCDATTPRSSAPARSRPHPMAMREQRHPVPRVLAPRQVRSGRAGLLARPFLPAAAGLPGPGRSPAGQVIGRRRHRGISRVPGHGTLKTRQPLLHLTDPGLKTSVPRRQHLDELRLHRDRPVPGSIQRHGRHRPQSSRHHHPAQHDTPTPRETSAAIQLTLVASPGIWPLSRDEYRPGLGGSGPSWALIGVLPWKLQGLLVDQRLFTPADQPGVQLVIVTGQQMLVMPARSRSRGSPATPGRCHRGAGRAGRRVTAHPGPGAGR